MSKFVTQKINIDGWKKVVKQLKKIKGGTFKEIIRAECAEILSTTANRKSTLEADKNAVVARHSPINIYFMGSKGRKEAYTVKEGQGGATEQKTYLLWHRMPDGIWNYIYERTREKTKNAVSNIGLNRGQFALMAKKLGISTGSKPFPVSSKRFLMFRQKVIDNKVFATESGKNDRKYKIEIESKLSRMISFGGGAKNIKSVMKHRIKKFEKALGKGVLQHIKKRNKQYPLIFTR